jgi:hypothetical protein
MVSNAGFVDIRLVPLLEIEQLERALLSDPTLVRPQFLITARRGSEALE